MTNLADGPERSGGKPRRRWSRPAVAGAVVVAAVIASRSPAFRPVDQPNDNHRGSTPTVTAPESHRGPVSPDPVAPGRESRPIETPGKPPTGSTADRAVVVRDVTIRDQSGRVVFRGDVDLAPTLERIAAGTRHEHRNDGGTFQNRERRLPRQPAGYYTEYVHPTPGVSGPGPQRVVLGRGGEAYYTPDHYRTFQRIE